MADEFTPVGGQDSAEMAETFYENRTYPQVPPGVYNAMIVKSELKLSKNEHDEPGTTKINLRLEIMSNLKGEPISYTGEDEKEHRYQVFSRPLAKNYGNGKKTGKPSNLYTLIKELTGIDPLTNEEQAERKLSDGRIVKGMLVTFDYKMLEFLECQVVIDEKEWNGKMQSEIRTYMCDAATRMKNWNLLPDHPKKVPLAGGVQSQQAQPQRAVDEVFKADKVQTAPADPVTLVNPSITAAKEAEAAKEVSEIRTPEQTSAIQKEMIDRGFPA